MLANILPDFTVLLFVFIVVVYREDGRGMLPRKIPKYLADYTA
jgi:hypothetical protein